MKNTVKNWKAIAAASGLEMPPADMERICSPLDALEAAFRPLARNLTPAVEPSTTLAADEDEE